nr:FAD-binding oxidoreductase [Amycolatopsis taiwanensis]
MSTQKVIVIGAGMVGLATAWYLQRDGAEVTVVDKRDVAAGSSWGNAGWLSPALTLPLPEPAILATGVRAALSPKSPVYVPPTAVPRLARFLTGFARHCTESHWRRALDVFIRANATALDAFDELTGSPAPVQAPTKAATPFLAAFAREADRRVLLDEFRHVNERGGSIEYTLLDRDAVRELEPALGEGVHCGITMSGQRFINPGQFVHALADAVKTGGGEIVTGRDVVAVERGGRARVVTRFADGGSMEADAVVIANGSWLGNLARRHGVRRLVQAGRGYSFTVYPEQTPKNPLYLPTQRVACTPLGEPSDGLRVAGMMEFRRPDDPLDPRRVRAIIEAAKPMLRGVDWSARTAEWVGSRPCTTDGLPLIGRTRTPGVHVAGGHGMWGIALGPLTGKLLAAQITRNQTDDLLRSFDPLR